MRRPTLTQRIAHGILPRARWIQHQYRTRHRRRRRHGACSHTLWPTRRTSLAKPKNPHAALVYLLLEPLSLGIPVKARCGVAKRPADSECHLPKSAGNNTRERHNPGSKGLMGSALLRQYRQHRLRIKAPCSSPGRGWFGPAPSPLSLTRLTVLTMLWKRLSPVAVILIVRIPNRPSRPNTISIPSVRRKLCARRSRPASARGLFGQPDRLAPICKR